MERQINVSAENLTVVTDNCFSLYTSKMNDLAIVAASFSESPPHKMEIFMATLRADFNPIPLINRAHQHGQSF